jgi:hypothetical protein
MILLLLLGEFHSILELYNLKTLNGVREVEAICLKTDIIYLLKDNKHIFHKNINSSRKIFTTELQQFSKYNLR